LVVTATGRDFAKDALGEVKAIKSSARKT